MRVVIVGCVVIVGGVAVLAPANLWVDGACAASGSAGCWARRLAPGGDSVECPSGFVRPKSVLIVVIVEHFVTPSKGPAEARSAAKMTICLHPS